MVYFDYMLSEALDKIEPTKEPKTPKKPWSDKYANDLLNKLRKNPNDIELQERLGSLRETNRKEFIRWYDKNRDNPDYRHALAQVGRDHSDNLVTWMLRHLVSKAQSG